LSISFVQSLNHQSLHHLIPGASGEESAGETGELHWGQAKQRGQSGKSGAGWVQKYQESGSEAELNTRVRDKLHKMQEELGVSYHPCKRAKRASPEISSKLIFGMCNNPENLELLSPVHFDEQQNV
jgi:hypothetical protein